MKKIEPLPLVNKYEIQRCRECGENIAVGSPVWWIREMGSAHRTCGWTNKSGKVHPVTKSSIQDIPAVRAVVKAKEAPAETRGGRPMFGQQESFMHKRHG